MVESAGWQWMDLMKKRWNNKTKWNGNRIEQCRMNMKWKREERKKEERGFSLQHTVGISEPAMGTIKM